MNHTKNITQMTNKVVQLSTENEQRNITEVRNSFKQEFVNNA